jgi:translation elongation factor EF-1alpha
MTEEQVGVVIKFFAKPSVAAIELTGGSIREGDRLVFRGHTTDFTQEVRSMEIDNRVVEEANQGDMVGLKVSQRVRENDRVYKVVE